jgi:putative ABC transport system substrate-binding protein
MRRREFLGLLGGVVVWPLALRAQQAAIRRIAVVLPASPDNQQFQAYLAAFVEQLARLGWSDGRNVRVEVRWASADLARQQAAAMELAADPAWSVIVTASNPLVAYIQSRIKTTPIVFTAVSDPVGGGFVSNIARPGGNMTGFENFQPETASKWLDLLKEAAPGVTRVGILLQLETSAHAAFSRALQGAARDLALETTAIGVHTAGEIERGITEFADRPDGGLIVLPHSLFTQNRDLIIAPTLRDRLPSIYPFRHFAVAGGLIAYGIDLVEQWRMAAGYVDRIMKGERPGDLPVQAPTKYELVINLRTARALGLNVPALMLARADEVIE